MFGKLTTRSYVACMFFSPSFSSSYIFEAIGTKKNLCPKTLWCRSHGRSNGRRSVAIVWINILESKKIFHQKVRNKICKVSLSQYYFLFCFLGVVKFTLIMRKSNVCRSVEKDMMLLFRLPKKSGDILLIEKKKRKPAKLNIKVINSCPYDLSWEIKNEESIQFILPQVDKRNNRTMHATWLKRICTLTSFELINNNNQKKKKKEKATEMTYVNITK